jgi:uncharacterized phage-associated protein
MSLKFAFSEAKAIEALAFVAREHPGLTPLYVAKVLFYAEKWHLNRYGRPILADTYIAMPLGPVPSTVKNFIDGNWEWVEKPERLDEAITIDRSRRLPRLMPGKLADDLSTLSESDIQCLSEAIAFCKDKTPEELSALTHFERAWQEADANRAMDYALFIDDDNPHREEILQMARENAAYGVL